MSVTRSSTRQTTASLRQRKGGEPIVALTAYDAITAQLLDEVVDLLLVGDSLGMVLYGMESTLPVTVEMMTRHGKAVAQAAQSACVVVDMPFASYQESPQQAFRNAAAILAESGAQAVKLEGGVEMAETIRFLVERGIPVMGHVGLTPQHVQRFGGFRVQGREAAGRNAILADAQAVSEAGAFNLVIEGVVSDLAEEITAAIMIPTIGIGASAACDGQILVTEDMLGLTPRVPKFAKRYAALAELFKQAAADYVQDVKNRRFPEPQHCYTS